MDYRKLSVGVFAFAGLSVVAAITNDGLSAPKPQAAPHVAPSADAQAPAYDHALTDNINGAPRDHMTDAERQNFRAEVRAYLLANPEVIMEAVAVLESRESMQQAESDIALVRTNADALFNDGYSWVGGNPDGDITLVEFMDYRCGYCRRAFEDVHELIKADGNIRFIVKEFPILGEESTLSARYAIATQQVAGEDAYEATHAALMAFTGQVNETTLTRLGDSLGHDAQAILAHMDSDEVTEVIAANHALGQRLSISGTPSFVMDDQMLRGYVPLEGMQQMAEEIRTQ